MTPTVNRLSWKDFMEPIAAAEDIANVSPNERIMWDKRPRMDGVSPLVARNAKNKRARSSSPISSPAADKNKTPAVNVRKLAQALKSPHADPTLELWDRFSLHKNDETLNTPLGITNPALAQLMISSSPRPSGRVRAGGGNLRRTISHGLNAPKRRKIDNSRSCSVASDDQREMEAASKSSLVSALLENATSSFNEHSPGEQMDRDRSPSPNKRRTSSSENGSPLRDKSQNTTTLDFSGSDYGDDDFDDESFMELEAKIAPSQASGTGDSSRHHGASSLNDSITIILSDDSEQTAEKSNALPGPGVAPARPLETPQRNNTFQPSAALQDIDDEFGDFDDDLDLEAVELVMTQSMKQANRSNLPVCRENNPE